MKPDFLLKLLSATAMRKCVSSPQYYFRFSSVHLHPPHTILIFFIHNLASCQCLSGTYQIAIYGIGHAWLVTLPVGTMEWAPKTSLLVPHFGHYIWSVEDLRRSYWIWIESTQIAFLLDLDEASKNTCYTLSCLISLLNTLRLRQNGRHFADDVFKYIFLNEKVWILIKISLIFIHTQ